MTDKPWTPGPWTPAGPSFGSGKPHWYDSVVTECYLEFWGDDNICELSDWTEDREQQNANAHLIAAAPELVEALEKCRQELELQREAADRCGNPDAECPLQDIFKPSDEHCQALEAADSALAKAHGKNMDEQKEAE